MKGLRPLVLVSSHERVKQLQSKGPDFSESAPPQKIGVKQKASDGRMLEPSPAHPMDGFWFVLDGSRGHRFPQVLVSRGCFCGPKLKQSVVSHQDQGFGITRGLSNHFCDTTKKWASLWQALLTIPSPTALGLQSLRKPAEPATADETPDTRASKWQASECFNHQSESGGGGLNRRRWRFRGTRGGSLFFWELAPSHQRTWAGAQTCRKTTFLLPFCTSMSVGGRVPLWWLLKGNHKESHKFEGCNQKNGKWRGAFVTSGRGLGHGLPGALEWQITWAPGRT